LRRRYGLLLRGLCAPDAIAIDLNSIKSACGGPSADTLTIPAVTVAGWTNRALIVSVGAKEDNADCNMAHANMNVSYRGTRLTLAVAGLSDTSGFRACDGVFYMLNPPVGTGDVTITFPATTGTAIDDRLAGAFVIYNVAQQAPEVTKSAGADALTNPVNTSITTLTDGAWVIDVMNQGGAGTFTTTQSGQTLRWQTSCGSSTLASSTKYARFAGSTTLGWSFSGPKRYAHALAAFKPAVVPPNTTTTLPAGCTTDPQCNDGNACTNDVCSSGTCQHTDVSAACNDGLFCDGVETCNPASGCQAGTPPATNDGIACTTDACNEATDTVTHTPNNAACSDGAFCNGAEVCNATLGCQAGTPPATSDGIACTVDACNEANDTITHAPNNAACDDANACTTDTCVAGTGCSYVQTCASAPITIDPSSIKTACGGPSADTLTIPAVTVAGWTNRVLIVSVGAKEDNADCNMAHASMNVSYRGHAAHSGGRRPVGYEQLPRLRRNLLHAEPAGRQRGRDHHIPRNHRHRHRRPAWQARSSSTTSRSKHPRP
jgi:hypothetical protein